jgi:hypothetical protein
MRWYIELAGGHDLIERRGEYLWFGRVWRWRRFRRAV